MKKILFVISSLRAGGAERALALLTEYLPENWEIDILLNGHQDIAYKYRGNILYLGIEGRFQIHSLLFQLKIAIKRIKKLRKLKRDGKYDACISFLDSANIANILTNSLQCKTIISVRNSLIEQERMFQYKYIVNPLVKLLYNRADKIVAVSRGVAKELIDDFHLKEERVVAIENGYNIEELKKKSKEDLNKYEEQIFENKKCIVTVGRLTEQKGQWHLIRAFTQIAHKRNDILLVVVGCGKLESYLKKVAEECGVKDKVIFMGYSDNPHKYVSRARMYVMSSLFEGFPNALAEAVCLEIPCIVTDFRTGAREILAPDRVCDTRPIVDISMEKYGIITPRCSGVMHGLSEKALETGEEALAVAMDRLLEDENLYNYYKRMCKERKQTLKMEYVVNKYEKIICGE